MFPDEDGNWSIYGPQVDGTYNIPSTAQQTNNPSNTAGFPSLSSAGALDFLRFGVQSITDTWKFNQVMDYKRYEATNGGVYQQGSPAAVAAARASQGNLLLIGLAVAGFLLLTHKG